MIHDSRERLIEVGLFLFGFFMTMLDYVSHMLGRGELFYDAREVWIPLSQEVLNGADLYITAVDNKPPVWEYIVIAAGATGEPTLALYVVVSLSNGLVAGLLYRWAARNYSPGIGLVSSVFFVGALPFMLGTVINVRSVALVPLFLALSSSNLLLSGTLIAASGLICQFAVFCIPAILYREWMHGSLTVRRFAKFAAAGVAVVTLAFASVGVFWGVDAAYRGVESSYISIGHYATVKTTDNPLRDPMEYLTTLISTATSIVYILIPATIFFIQKRDFNSVDRVTVAFALCLSLPLLVKSIPYYWVLPTPFLSILAVRGVQTLVE